MSKTHCYGKVMKKGLAMLLSMTLLLGSTLPGVAEGINATLADENGSVCILCLAETVGVVQL